MDLVPRVKAAFGTHPHGFLITPADAGWRHARLVRHVTIDDDLSVWIGTSRRSRKVAETRRWGHATYAVEDRASVAAVMLSGRRRGRGRSADHPLGRRVRGRSLPQVLPATITRWCALPDEIKLIAFAHGVHPDPYRLVSQRFALTPAGWLAA